MCTHDARNPVGGQARHDRGHFGAPDRPAVLVVRGHAPRPAALRGKHGSQAIRHRGGL